jgi:hypothetical protein
MLRPELVDIPLPDNPVDDVDDRAFAAARRPARARGRDGDGCGVLAPPEALLDVAAPTPLTCVIFALLVQSIRHVRTMSIARRPFGIALSWAMVALLAIDTGSAIKRHSCDPLSWTCQGDPSRAAIQKKLENTPGKHLVIVRYEENHNVHDEWVFNGAEIDNAKVLWSRELSFEQNEKLFAYFKDRQIWLVSPDIDNTDLLPYPLANAPPDL